MENRQCLTNRQKSMALFRWTIRKYLPFSIAYWILLFITFPMVEIFGLVVCGSSGKMKEYTKGMKEIITFLPGTFFAMVAIAFSTIIAIMAFSYMHNKRRVDLFGSFPVGRRTLFFVRYLAVLALSIVPVIVIGAIGGLLGLCNTAIIYSFKTVAIITLSIIGNVSFVALISLCCGTVADVIISYLVINGVYPICVAICYLFPISVLPGLKSGTLPDFVFTMLTPGAAVFVTEFGSSRLLGILWWIVFSIALIAGSFVLCKKRKAEAAQNAFAFNIVEIIIKFITCFAGGFGFGYMLSYLGDSSKGMTGQYAWFFTGAIIAILTANILLHLVFHRGLSNFRGSFIECGAVLVFITLFLFSVTTGGFGYVDRLPEENEVQEVSIRIGEENEFHVKGKDIFEKFSSDREMIKDALDLHKVIVEDTKSERKSGIMAINSHDTSYEFRVESCIKITYKLKSGKRMTRYYTHYSDTKGIRDKVKKIENSAYYHKQQNAFGLIPNQYISYIDISQSIYDEEEESFEIDGLLVDENKEKCDKLIKALSKDVKTHGLQTDSSNEETALSINIQYENMLSDYENETYYSTVFVSKDYTNTLQVLKELGYGDYLKNFLNYMSGEGELWNYQRTGQYVYFKAPKDWSEDKEVRAVMFDGDIYNHTDYEDKMALCEKAGRGLWRYNILKAESEDEEFFTPDRIMFIQKGETIKISGAIDISHQLENKLLELKDRKKGERQNYMKPLYDYQWSDYDVKK